MTLHDSPDPDLYTFNHFESQIEVNQEPEIQV